MEPEVLRKVLKVIPDRIHTIIPGMIVLQTMIKHFGCEEIQVSPYGAVSYTHLDVYKRQPIFYMKYRQM